MDPDKNEQRKKNLLVGWTIGVLAIVLYAASFYFGAGQS